jgi:hypothetical protein
MGSGQVIATILDWATAALHEHPLLVAPTLVIAVGVIGTAVVEAATLTIEVATAMLRHYKKRFSELSEAVHDFRDTISGKRHSTTNDNMARRLDFDSTRDRNVQRERLSQQRLFDKRAVNDGPGSRSG